LPGTIVVIAADHGEVFGERGVEGHARNVFKEVTEVRFVISFPLRLAPGVVVDAHTRNVDIWPTLFDRLEQPANPDTDGRSLVPERLAAARGEPAPAPNPVGIAHIDQNWGQRNRRPAPNVAVRDGTLRYARLPDGDAPAEQLFDAARDPREFDDLAAAQPETVAKLRAIADGDLASRPSGATRRAASSRSSS
jgi:arylsulfatase A-like enzyme